MPTGKIKFFNERGYGFIERSGEPDVFFHISAFVPDESHIDTDPMMGDVVEFETEIGRKGIQAKQVFLRQRRG